MKLKDGEKWILVPSYSSPEGINQVVELEERDLDDALFNFVFVSLGYAICKINTEGKVEIV